jgi:hypothetical protein
MALIKQWKTVATRTATATLLLEDLPEVEVNNGPESRMNPS